ncbi:GNAT family N-acetyltransferase [Undibacterium cyanobacteriorum]|uniref:GNAT family N-acetyltransferase n=1 Tax=Undibacterium cyanobacteriorum TaxID=3073561 RepID=A0ABY9RLJ0_9BURK|nr:GNAT family N-acetyltransferase [Undibacterium sp. 20NA77.5]WMW82085.1 GNAT family N-acetyltransferase [Undibacterium sp. 20NA77.5]
MDIRLDDLSDPRMIALIELHTTNMASISPPESCHALAIDALRSPKIRLWGAWDGEELMGCGALKELDPEHAEIKSMRTAEKYLKQGVAAALLDHLIAEARQSGYRRLSLETGTQAEFKPAEMLYRKFGFEVCGPFADYVLGPLSLFMTRSL